MSVSLEEVERIASLAKLSFSTEEMQIFVEQFNQILRYIEKLAELDTADVPPTTHTLTLQNVMREDVVCPWLSQEQALINAPQQKNGFFSVPKVIG